MPRQKGFILVTSIKNYRRQAARMTNAIALFVLLLTVAGTCFGQGDPTAPAENPYLALIDQGIEAQPEPDTATENPYLALIDQDIAQQSGAGAQAENPYLALIDQDIAAEQARMAAVIDTVLPRNPDVVAEAAALAAEFGLDIPTIEANQEEFSRLSRRKRIQTLAATNPVLARHLRDPDWAARAAEEARRNKERETAIVWLMIGIIAATAVVIYYFKPWRWKARTRTARIAVVVTVAWVLFVAFRTASDYELAGVELDAWDEDYLLLNILLPIAVGFSALFAGRWVAGQQQEAVGEKSGGE